LLLASNSFVARNKIDGSGKWALMATQYKKIKANGNSFAWNDVREFKASAGDFLCVGNQNTFFGAKCKVVDSCQEGEGLALASPAWPP
jgi:hypothetical protein